MLSFDDNSASAQMDQYSRQIGAYGIETMKNLAALSVLVVGASGTGFEAAKDLILAGPKAVAICDKTPVAIADLGTNAFLTKEDVGKPRAACCVSKLAVLNPYVRVSECAELPTAESLKEFGAVLVTDSFLPLETLVAWDNACRASSTVFLLAFCNGVVCSIFSDFGPKHVSTDLTGEPDHILPIDRFELKEEPFSIRVHVNSANHGLEDGAQVTIGGAKGVEVFEQVGNVGVKRCYTTYDGGKRKRLEAKYFDLVLSEEQAHTLKEHAKEIVDSGFVTEVRQKKEFHFVSLEESLLHPATPETGMIPCPSMEKMFANRGEQLHFARLGVWEFAKANGGMFPRLHNMEDADAVLKFAQAKLDEFRKIDGAVTVQSLDENVIKNFSLYYRAELLGLCTFAGGVIAQEVVKKFGKFTPLERWLEVDFLEMLPEKAEVRPDAAPKGTRYDHVISLFGAGLQDKLSKMNWFMVGCGALGCEYLKAFSLLGIATAPGASVSVTDMDRIEVSNLSRQFLFRRENVGQQKAVCAANAARAFNPDFHVTCYETKVCPETENIFNDAFWSKLDGVCNALDNIPARKYVDSRCVFYEKPLLESGTEGTKASSDVIIPFQTNSFSQRVPDSSESSNIPMCTLRNFPNTINHCIEWARAQFSDLFESPIRDIASVLRGDTNSAEELLKQAEIEGNAVSKLERLQRALTVLSPFVEAKGNVTFSTCIEIALRSLYDAHTKKVEDLTFSLPKGMVKEDPLTHEKLPFWSGSKRFPRVVSFDVTPADSLRNYLFAAANLFATLLGVDLVNDRTEFDRIITEDDDKLRRMYDSWSRTDRERRVLSSLAAKNISEKEVSFKISDEEVEQHIEEVKQILKVAEMLGREHGINARQISFEKDDDTNFHIDFITASANMRAWNYYIPETTRFQCKMIAGKIIPALATTTAAITGINTVELIKFAIGDDKVSFECSNIFLNTSRFIMYTPSPPEHAEKEYDVIENSLTVPIPDGFTCWDKVTFDVRGLTVSEAVAKFPSIHYGVRCTMLYMRGSGSESTIYNEDALTPKLKEQQKKHSGMLFKEVCRELYGDTVADSPYIILDGSFMLEDNVVKVPLIKCIL